MIKISILNEVPCIKKRLHYLSLCFRGSLIRVPVALISTATFRGPFCRVTWLMSTMLKRHCNNCKSNNIYCVVCKIILRCKLPCHPANKKTSLAVVKRKISPPNLFLPIVFCHAQSNLQLSINLPSSLKPLVIHP